MRSGLSPQAGRGEPSATKQVATRRDTLPHSRGSISPGFCIFIGPLLRGRREGRAPTAPAAPCAMVVRNAHGFDRYSRDIPAFPAQWVYGLLRALPGERPFLPPLPLQHGPEGIDARIAAPGPHDFAVRFAPLVNARGSVHRIPPHGS